jgi:hypothetical protein
MVDERIKPINDSSSIYTYNQLDKRNNAWITNNYKFNT